MYHIDYFLLLIITQNILNSLQSGTTVYIPSCKENIHRELFQGKGRLGARNWFFIKGRWAWSRLPRTVLTASSCWILRSVWAPLSGTGFGFCVVLSGTKSWNSWSWNGLLRAVVESPSLEMFKIYLAMWPIVGSLLCRGLESIISGGPFQHLQFCNSVIFECPFQPNIYYGSTMVILRCFYP